MLLTAVETMARLSPMLLNWKVLNFFRIVSIVQNSIKDKWEDTLILVRGIAAVGNKFPKVNLFDCKQNDLSFYPRQASH